MEVVKSEKTKFVPLALFLAVISISFAAIFFRLADDTNPVILAGIRLAVAGIILLPLTIRSALRGALSKRLILFAVAAGLAYGIHFGAWVTSLTLTSVAASVTLVTTTPLILAIAGIISGKDRPFGILWLGLFLAFIGLSIIGGIDFLHGPQALRGDLLAFVGALAMAAYMIIGRKLGDEMDLWAFSGIACMVGATALLGVAFISGIPLLPNSYQSFIYIVLAAIIPQLIGHNLLTWTLKFTKPSVVAMAVVGEPVGATFLAWLWLKDPVTLSIVIGCAITLTGVALSILNHQVDEKR